MKNVLALALLGSLLLVSAHAAWELQWKDEFNGNSLDTNKWVIESNCWSGNGEKQCYTNRPENVYVRNGSLHLNAVAGAYTGSLQGCTNNAENSCTWTRPSTSGRIKSTASIDGSFTYGRFEVRAKLPKGNFLWPAIWMIPTEQVYGTWPNSGEIDIMEARGQDVHDFSSAIHYGPVRPNNMHKGSGAKTYPFDMTADFHIYSLEWDKTQLRMFVDNRLHFTTSLTVSFGDMYSKIGAPFDQKFHFILNVAVAGNFFDVTKYGTFDVDRDSRTWTQPMQVDYVRVYKYVEDPAPVVPPRPSPPPPSAPIGSHVSLVPEHDAYVDASQASSNFNADDKLRLLRTDNNNIRSAYVRFSIPQGRVPASATLKLFGALSAEGTATNEVVVYRVLSSASPWTESRITHGNRPDICGTCPSATTDINKTWKNYEVDVLSLVQSAIQSGSESITFRVSLTANGEASFRSRVHASNKPTLLINYA